jgi:NitT/TauT family transport system substrate-binding protein
LVKRKAAAAIFAVLALASAGCASSAARARGSADVLRLGIFPNLTHAPGHVAIGSGILQRKLRGATELKVTVFNSGSDAGNALLAGSIDATYIGPGPATSLFLSSSGKVAIVSGAAAGGAALVVRKGTGIASAEDLRGKKVAVPGIGNTQDVALRTWLHQQGLKAQDEGGDVAVVPVDNPELRQLFQSDELHAAWEPEPWPSLLVGEGLADVLIDEATLWPNGEFVTTQLLVSTTYLQAHPVIVERLVAANVEALQLIEDDPERAKSIARTELAEAGAPTLPPNVLDQAWGKLTFTSDPIPASLEKGARDAFDLGYLEEEPTSILDIYRLDSLNGILRRQGLPAVEVAA